jgi:hypothetical protein
LNFVEEAAALCKSAGEKNEQTLASSVLNGGYSNRKIVVFFGRFIGTFFSK